MKEYDVVVETNVEYITVEANSEEEAKRIAIEIFQRNYGEPKAEIASEREIEDEESL